MHLVEQSLLRSEMGVRDLDEPVLGHAETLAANRAAGGLLVDTPVRMVPVRFALASVVSLRLACLPDGTPTMRPSLEKPSHHSQREPDTVRERVPEHKNGCPNTRTGARTE